MSDYQQKLQGLHFIGALCRFECAASHPVLTSASDLQN